MSTLTFRLGTEYKIPKHHPLIDVEVEIQFNDGQLVSNGDYEFFEAVSVAKIRVVHGDRKLNLVDLFRVQSKYADKPAKNIREYEARLCFDINSND